ncbi:hypothetical protein V1264_008731 [Littorina saxatilis]|uniref:C2H2-type domain-containing protein n=2 Tax=Littorina saxatilis TaxID=31220 RepID=A0AAN9G3Y2_9CAEN
MMGGRERDGEGERPYSCPVPGCKKRYKNVNGIKYHARHGHKNESSKVKKSYRCYCGKSYRSALGLRNHTTLQHPASDFTTTTQHVTLTHNLLSPLATLSPTTALSSKDSPLLPDSLSLHPSSLSRTGTLATLAPSRAVPQKVAAQVKALALATSKGQGQTAFTLPIGTPVRFISQPASVVPVAVKSVKLSSTIG